MSASEWVRADPAVTLGKPVVKGTRVTVESILERLAGGESIDQIVDSHPRLTRDAVLAALDYAARSLRGEAAYPIPDRAA